MSSAFAVASDVSKSSNVPVTPPIVIPFLIYSGNKLPLFEPLFDELYSSFAILTLIAFISIIVPIIATIVTIAIKIINFCFLFNFSIT